MYNLAEKLERHYTKLGQQPQQHRVRTPEDRPEIVKVKHRADSDHCTKKQCVQAGF